MEQAAMTGFADRTENREEGMGSAEEPCIADRIVGTVAANSWAGLA